ncbi:MAG: hypothetical protein HY367_03875 [Candidatus Aenigmarchaeota archaeon]|nr:hypothetical protein [Candidatus Aenigmarchaeota archaeon]
MKYISKIAPLALAAGLAGCSGETVEFARVEYQHQNHPQYRFDIESERVRDTGNTPVTIIALDVDGDRQADEALIISGYTNAGQTDFGSFPRKNWKHLVAKDLPPAKMYILTDNTREMTPEERDALAVTGKLLNSYPEKSE